MLKSSVASVLSLAWESLGLPLATVEVNPSDRPEFGDFSTNLPLIGAKAAGLPPRKLAERLVPLLLFGPFSRVEVAGPGFINLFLKPAAIHAALQEIIRSGDRFGSSAFGKGESLQIEFVSSNPTGPLTVGHGRQAVLGDVLASLYQALGYTVTREYYFNDEGRQIDLLAESLWARYRRLSGVEVEIPEGGYHGEYLVDIAREVKDEVGDRFPDFAAPAALFFRRAAVSRIKETIEDDLTRLGVGFDRWFSEGDLHKSGKVTAALDTLRERNGIYKKDGAVWLKAEENGGVKDSVLIRGDGRPTYLMVDIAYHIDKYDRGFDRVIAVQGADHQVEQSCMKAAMRILGYPEKFLDYAVHQFVTIKEGEETARMSTRAGRFIRLRDLTDEIGRDVVRYFMIARKPESHLQFDLESARAESLDNPVYYIQYAHTRISSIFRKAGTAACHWEEVDLSSLKRPGELDLIKRLDRFPEVVSGAALGFAPHLLAGYTLDLARAFHAYYGEQRVLGTGEEIMKARLALLQGLQIVFRRSLEILGMSVPEEM